MKTILECVVGSTLYGTAVPGGPEDLDLMAVVIEDRKDVLGFNTSDVWVTRTKPVGVRGEAGDVDHTAYGLRKYLNLALAGNPTILLALFAPPEFWRVMTPEGTALQKLAPAIVSKKAYMPFKGYMHQQHLRLLGQAGQKRVTRPELTERYGFDTKYAAHIVRLGLQGAELLGRGRITLPMEPSQRKMCVDIRTGVYTLPEVSGLIQQAEAMLERAFFESTLRSTPDYAAVERWMIETYLGAWK